MTIKSSLLALSLLVGGCLDRSGAGDLRLFVWGDVRPSCRTGVYPPEVPAVLRALGAAHRATPADLVVTTGDYLCAWPWEGPKALDQLQQVVDWYPESLWPRTVWTLGNHEVGHQQLVRSARTSATSQGWVDLRDLRVVWLPSDQDTTSSLERAWLDRALTHDGRLVVVRHEPWGSCGTCGDGWIRDRVRAARPSLVAFGHVHTWAAPGTTLHECGREVVLGPNEVVVGNGGAPGWRESVGWVGYTTAILRSSGGVELTGHRASDGSVAASSEVKPLR